MENGRKVLIIDDDLDIVESMRIVLESRNYHVLTAYDPKSGYEMAKSEKPALILLDIMMPSGAEGFQFVWKLRNDADKEVSGLPILVVSAVHSKTDLKLYPDQEDSTYEAGEYLPVQAFLDKPVQPGDLLESVARHVK